MPYYIFQGRVLPERAQITIQMGEVHLKSLDGKLMKVWVNIFLNQIMVYVDVDDDDIYTLRNFVLDFVSGKLAVLAFTHGHAYDVEITRVITPSREVDQVFGIDIPCLHQSQLPRDPSLSLETLNLMTMAEHGYFLHRFFTDLTLAMKNAIDTGFYCYRALESLRQHCCAIEEVAVGGENRNSQWETFRMVAQVKREEIEPIAEAAKAVRHGGFKGVTDLQRQNLLTSTFKIAEKYFLGIRGKVKVEALFLNSTSTEPTKV